MVGFIRKDKVVGFKKNWITLKFKVSSSFLSKNIKMEKNGFLYTYIYIHPLLKKVKFFEIIDKDLVYGSDKPLIQHRKVSGEVVWI